MGLLIKNGEFEWTSQNNNIEHIDLCDGMQKQ